ncbi:unnamed protein product [Brassicogethes aeneus]|uniref:Uncharacterized protein n=1 Tax=Brassicogethes aeneus TaxID=1431903 RepID=A0A9P0BEH8_BRAAE|nr:unnamed protein product [Brassicogethes aeneus]
MNKKIGTMKSEEEDEAMGCSDLPPSSEMTFNENEDCTSPYMDQTPEIMDPKFSPMPTKFDGINLEDDIEKVEVTSHESSSEESEDEVPKVIPSFLEQHPADSLKNWLQKLSATEPLKNITAPLKVNENITKNLVQNPSRVVKYQDLPYMGEMTLDNSKPRRGRKPKKADICHLIYKNYGTIFPGTPNPKTYTDSSTTKKPADDLKSDVQNRIISSLLEKRLTQEKKDKAQNKNQHEPLNLCIRDLNHLKIRLLKNTDNTYTSEIKSEPQSDDDVEFVHETPSPSIKNEMDCLSSPSPDLPKTPDNANGYVYWPNAGVFIHPMALQQQLMMYQRLASNGNCTLPKPPVLDPKNLAETTTELRKIVPKIKVKKLETNGNAEVVQKSKRTASSVSEKTPTKRKRSAIFIPPIQSENTSNPATEVSICKFKFTGGAKPSLQEKKMLSVDSGGNFRYYSGTGDKSMRGYEFFPRETLQQQANNNQGSSTGAFLQASGEKIYPVPPVDFAPSKTPLDFQLNPETSQVALQQHPDNSRHSNKKRKSRKSLQREKLEQTFKEKGFLIQTQQLESAEGATYCKFRQLRKFTRYLFRSWKDYLPGNVGEIPEGERPENPIDPSDIDIDNLSVHSSELSSSNVQC